MADLKFPRKYVTSSGAVCEALVAERNCILIDNNHEYCCAAHNRLIAEAGASPASEILQETLYGRTEMVKHLVVKETGAHTDER